jgi:hypothetical protein
LITLPGIRGPDLANSSRPCDPGQEVVKGRIRELCLLPPPAVSHTNFAHGIAAQAGTTDLLALQQNLMDELCVASMNAVQFAQAFFAAAWIKHFGEVIDAEDVVKIEGAALFDQIALPFFVEIQALEKAGESQACRIGLNLSIGRVAPSGVPGSRAAARAPCAPGVWRQGEPAVSAS